MAIFERAAGRGVRDVARGIGLLALVSIPSVAQAQVAPVIAPNPPTAAVDPARLALGRQIIAVVLPPNQRERMMQSVLTSMMQSMTQGVLQGVGADLAGRADVRAVFDRFVARQQKLAMGDLKAALPDLVEAYARSYARNFSLDELQQIAGFVRTPAGAAYVQRSPALLGDPDVMAAMRGLTARGAARQGAEVQRLKQEIDALRPAPATKGATS